MCRSRLQEIREWWAPEVVHARDPVTGWPITPPAQRDIRVLLAEIDRLQALVDELHSVLQEAAEEIEYWHSDMLSPEERAHPRGSGWARVYGRIKDALGGQIQSRRCETCRWWYGACDVLSQTTHRNFGCARWEAESKP